MMENPKMKSLELEPHLERIVSLVRRTITSWSILALFISYQIITIIEAAAVCAFNAYHWNDLSNISAYSVRFSSNIPKWLIKKAQLSINILDGSIKMGVNLVECSMYFSDRSTNFLYFRIDWHLKQTHPKNRIKCYQRSLEKPRLFVPESWLLQLSPKKFKYWGGGFCNLPYSNSFLQINISFVRLLLKFLDKQKILQKKKVFFSGYIRFGINKTL